ncbi:MAG: hypothetical protein F6J98_01550 [Moorea sp. SIO4G2]|nr:hypothetical protein [Moorena sp. SIO4G2]
MIRHFAPIALTLGILGFPLPISAANTPCYTVTRRSKITATPDGKTIGYVNKGGLYGQIAVARKHAHSSVTHVKLETNPNGWVVRGNLSKKSCPGTLTLGAQ